MLSRDVIDSLFPSDLPEPEHWEQRYPPRELPAGAKVTRFAPSPTGFLHIGGVFTATIDADVARQSGGVYLVRLEDTDRARIVEGAEAQFAEAFSYFSISPDEGGEVGQYGPYAQSARWQTYLTYVRELLRRDRAYPCFATKEELEEITARQRAAGALPGYYGTWAIWRDAEPEQVAKRLAAGEPYVVRFRSPGASGARVSFTDAIRGELTADDNRNDVVILKSSGTEPRLPTYHFAHAVDDHLMRVNLVIRGEEWLSSVPLHLQLFDALGFERVQYAHIALLMKQQGGSRRKLSKRKDPEATVSFYVEQGYPAPAVQYYLRGLANGRLAELPLPEALAAPIRLSECGTAGPLVDMVKLDDICADYVATLSGEQILAEVSTWAGALRPRPRGGPGGRAATWRCVRWTSNGWASPTRARTCASGRTSVPSTATSSRSSSSRSPTRPTRGSRASTRTWCGPWPGRSPAGTPRPRPETDWFDQIRRLAAELGFAPNQKVYKQDPHRYKGSIREASQVIRVLLTGTPRSPDLAQVAARARHRRGPAPGPRGHRLAGAVPGAGLSLVLTGRRPGADHRQLVQAVQVQLLCFLQHDVLLFLRLLGDVLG